MKNSSLDSFQSYITAKSKAQQGADEKESASERGMSAKAAFNDRFDFSCFLF
jgi:hypothetical protein